MGRVEQDFRDVLVETLKSILIIYSTNDVVNDKAAMNRLTSTVTFLEDILYPYCNQGRATEYQPPETKDEYVDVHHRLRALTKVGRAVALLPAKRVSEDVGAFTVEELE